MQKDLPRRERHTYHCVFDRGRGRYRYRDRSFVQKLRAYGTKDRPREISFVWGRVQGSTPT